MEESVLIGSLACDGLPVSGAEQTVLASTWDEPTARVCGTSGD